MPSNSASQGVVLALSAYIMWGIAPIYFKTLTHIPASNVLAQRVIWSCLLIAVLLFLGRQWHKVFNTVRQPRVLMLLGFTALLIGSNWLIFIWAVNNDRLLDASLGYFINPLVNVVLAMLFLHERFRPLQWMAVALAGSAVAVQIISYGQMPWVAFALALSFGGYGLLRKKVSLDTLPGLFIETTLLLPLAGCYLILNSEASYIYYRSDSLLLAASGVVTTLPLLAFTAAAVRLKLSTLSMFQYIAPSTMFLLAVLVYDEALDQTKVMVFALIWTALAVFSWEGIRHRRKQKLSL